MSMKKRISFPKILVQEDLFFSNRLPPGLKFEKKSIFKNLLKSVFNFYPRRRAPKIHSKIKNIAIFRFGGIGDLIALTGFIKTLRKAYSPENIILVTSDLGFEILKNHPEIDQIVCHSRIQFSFCWKKLISDVYFLQKLGKRKIDIAFFTHNDHRSLFMGHFLKSRYKIGHNNNNNGYRLSLTHFASMFSKTSKNAKYDFSDGPKMFFELLEAFESRKFPNSWPSLILQESEISWAKKELKNLGFTKNMVAFLPGGTEPNKLWPSKYWINLAKEFFQDSKYQIVLLTGAEQNYLKNEFKSSSLNLNTILISAGDYNLRESLALLSLCKVAIGNDTGFMHAAVALGLKTIGLFGPTSFFYYGYISFKNCILQGACKYSPCGLGICPLLSTRDIPSPCMKSISVPKVYEKFVTLTNLTDEF